MCLLKKPFLYKECHHRNWHFNDCPHPWICRSDSFMKLPAASLKVISAQENDFSRAAATSAYRGFCSGHPASQNFHLNSADGGWEGGSKCCFLQHSTPFSVSSPTSLSSQVAHKNQDFFLLLLTNSQNSLAN